MPREFPNNQERTLASKIRRGIGLIAAGGLLASGATLAGRHMERSETAGTAEITASQQAFLDKTAAAAATRLLHDRFAFAKEVRTTDETTTINVTQDIPKEGTIILPTPKLLARKS